MQERAIVFGPGRSLVGVVSIPEVASDCPRPGVIFLNAGLVHRIGPNRVYVRLARALASRGVSSLRFDFSGIGDSPSTESDESLLQRCCDEARNAITVLEKDFHVGPVRLVGLCSGADVALQVAQIHPAVVGAALINPAVAGSPTSAEDAHERTLWRYYGTRLGDPRAWGRLLTGRSDIRTLASAISRRLFGRRNDGPERVPPPGPWRFVGTTRAHLLLVLSEGSTAWDVLDWSALEGRGGRLRIVRFSHCDHVFTPLRIQSELVETVLDWALGG